MKKLEKIENNIKKIKIINIVYVYVQRIFIMLMLAGCEAISDSFVDIDSIKKALQYTL